MRKAYLFIYNDDLGTRQQVRDHLEKLPQILNWRYDSIPNAFYLISEADAATLSTAIKKMSPGQNTAAFLVVEIGENRQGWLIDTSWKLINEKHLPGQ